MQILDGKLVSKTQRERIAQEVKDFVSAQGRPPGLAVVLVGEDPASEVYVRNKGRACEEVGIFSLEKKLPAETPKEELKKLIYSLNEDPKIDGILVQLPLPKSFDESEVIQWIHPTKDPDGLTLENQGLLMSGNPRVKSCTPYGVMKILEHFNIGVEGKNAVVVGRSNIVGKPMAQLLQMANATVTVCHSRTPNTSEITRQADIVVVAAGKPKLLGKNDFKKDAVVIDVGIHREPSESGKAKLCGDVRFDELDGHVAAATPVPGGVGPMTITMLLQNTLDLARANS